MTRKINHLQERSLYIFYEDNDNLVDRLLEIIVRDFTKVWDCSHDIPQTSNNATDLLRIKKNLSIYILITIIKFYRPKITTKERKTHTPLIPANTVRIALGFLFQRAGNLPMDIRYSSISNVFQRKIVKFLCFS